MIGAAVGSRRDAGAVTLAILGTAGLALAVPDPRIAVLAATAGGVFGALVCIAPLGGRAGATVGVRVLRATVVAGTMAIAATAWIGRDLSDLAAQPVVFGLAYLAMAIAVAIRFGAIPLHAWAARLTDSVPETTLPQVTAWGPAALAIVAVAWADTSIAPLLVDVENARLVVLAIAIASILLASIAALIQDDLEHVVGYAIIGDAGVVMLAVAALDPAAWAPARMWILSFVVARSAFAAWAAATRTTFSTGRITDLRGWAIRSPLLAVGFVAVVVASIGLPGLAAFEARGTLIDLTLGGPAALIVWIGVLSPILYYGRLFAIGLGRPEPGHRRRAVLAAADHAAVADRRARLAVDDLVRQPARRGVRRGARPVGAGPGGLGRPVRRAGGVGRAAADARRRGRVVPAGATRRAARERVPGGEPGARRVRSGVRAGADAVRVAPARGCCRRSPSVGRREHPAVDVALVVEQLGVVEPQRELGRGGVRSVRGMDDVLGRLQREVTADRARGGLVRTGRPVDGADDGDRVGPVERERDQRRRGDEVDQAAEERLVAMRVVVASRRSRG